MISVFHSEIGKLLSQVPQQKYTDKNYEIRRHRIVFKTPYCYNFFDQAQIVLKQYIESANVFQNFKIQINVD